MPAPNGFGSVTVPSSPVVNSEICPQLGYFSHQFTYSPSLNSRLSERHLILNVVPGNAIVRFVSASCFTIAITVSNGVSFTYTYGSGLSGLFSLIFTVKSFAGVTFSFGTLVSRTRYKPPGNAFDTANPSESVTITPHSEECIALLVFCASFSAFSKLPYSAMYRSRMYVNSAPFNAGAVEGDPFDVNFAILKGCLTIVSRLVTTFVTSFTLGSVYPKSTVYSVSSNI